MKVLKNILIMIVCGIINYLLCFFVQQILELPIFFDTVMVMAVLFAFGLVPSIGTLLVHYIIAISRDYLLYKTAPYIALYMICGVVIIIISWLFIRKKEKFQKGVNSTFLWLLLASLTAAFCSSIVGGTINTIILKYVTLDENWQGMLLSLGSFRLNLCFSLIIGRIPQTCLDRVITTFAGYGIFFMYKKIHSSKSKEKQ